MRVREGKPVTGWRFSFSTGDSGLADKELMMFDNDDENDELVAVLNVLRTVGAGLAIDDVDDTVSAGVS